MLNQARILAAVAVLALAAPALRRAFAETAAARLPDIAGLSQERLGKLASVLRSDVNEGRIPGAVVLIARGGQVALFEAIGFRDRAANAPMQKDAIFRLYSMTKPIVSVAATLLVAEGRLLLSDPVSSTCPSSRA